MQRGFMTGRSGFLGLALPLAVFSACTGATNAGQPQPGKDASADVGADGGDSGAKPTRDAGPAADSTAGPDGATADSGPPLGVSGKSWYVAKGAPGTRTSSCTSAGTSWTNAWGEMDQIGWSCIQPGDTIWLAGGTYTKGFAAGASGTASKPIYVARVLSTDKVPTSADGWKASFDSQVLVTNTTANNDSAGCNAGDVLCFNDTNLGNYTYWDGRVDSGIMLQTSNIAGLSPTNNTRNVSTRMRHEA
jgi:hypothetical protein